MNNNVKKYSFVGVSVILFFGLCLSAQEPLLSANLHDTAEVICIPIYPRVASASGQSGDLLAKISVGSDGQCKIVKIDGGSHFLVEGVRKAIAGWKFLPRKTVYTMVIRFSFQLLPSTANDSELVCELFPVLNKVVIKSRRPNLENGLVTDPPVLPNK